MPDYTCKDGTGALYPTELPLIFGIDLGTTNSLIACLKNGVPTIIPNALGQPLTPSVVSLDDDGSLLIGQAARERLVTHPDQTVASFKRMMGTQHAVSLGDRTFLPEELSALVLRRLKEDAEAMLGQVVDEVVISVPAYFNDQQRKATRMAGEIAGLKVRRLINEPTAAALFHGIHERDKDAVYLVFDLGGGTFDVSILERFSGIMEVRATGGDSFLGGDDFTSLLVDLIVSRAGLNEDQRANGEVLAALTFSAEVAKRTLSHAETAEIQFPPQLGLPGVKLTTDEVESSCKPLLDRLRAPIEQALRDSRLRVADMHEIVLVGGATRMPMVRRLVSQLFGRLPARYIDPDQTIALGAAVCGGLIAQDAAFEEMVLTDVCPHSLGTAVAEPDGRGGLTPGIFLPIIERNTVVPASRVRTVTTLRDLQTELRVDVFQGESRLCEHNVHLGELLIPVPARKAGEVVANIRYTYDANGILDVDVDIAGSNVKYNKLIEQIAGEMSAAEIEQRRAGLARLKIHPRDQEKNRALLARAERLFQQLLGEQRQQIGVFIRDFTAILESQDPQRIGVAYQHLVQILDSIEKNAW